MKCGAALMALALALMATVAQAGAGVAAERQASKFLRQAGQRLNSPELTALAQEASEASGKVDPGTLNGVKDMIRNMLASKMADHAEATSRKAFCDKESANSKAKVQRLKDEMEKSNADLDKLQAVLAETKDDITDLHADLAKIQKSKAELTKIRTEEHNTYAESKAAYEAQAYPADEAARDAASLRQVKLEQAEADAAFGYKRMQNKMQEGLARKTQGAKNKDTSVIKMNRQVSMAENDLRELKEELAASVDYKEQIDHQCIARAEPVKERQARRHEEIESLKDAYGVLSGEDIPVMSS